MKKYKNNKDKALAGALILLGKVVFEDSSDQQAQTVDDIYTMLGGPVGASLKILCQFVFAEY